MVALNRVFGAAGDALARPTGHSFPRYLVLREAQAGSASVAELARRLRLARQGVQRMADAMADEGLITYVDNPQHRRAKLVQITDAGQAALERIATAQREWTHELGERVGADKLVQANQLLDDVLRVVEPD